MGATAEKDRPIHNPVLETANRSIWWPLKKLGDNFKTAVRQGNTTEAVRLVDEAKDLKYTHFPFTIIRGGRI